MRHVPKDARIANARHVTAQLIALGASLLGALCTYAMFSARADAGELAGWAAATAAVWCGAAAAVFACVRAPGEPNAPLRQHRGLVTVAAASGISAASLGGGLVLTGAPVLGGAIREITSVASGSPGLVIGVALLAGAGEELFFRLGVQRAFAGPYAWLWSIVLYVSVTLATGNPALVVMALVLGVACSASLQLTGWWLTPLLIHGSWTLTMVGLFPWLLNAGLLTAG